MLINRLACALAAIAITTMLFPPDVLAAVSPRDSWGLHVIWGNKDHDGVPQVRGGYITPEWADVNPAPGVYDFSRLDEELARYQSLGKQVTVSPLSAFVSWTSVPKGSVGCASVRRSGLYGSPLAVGVPVAPVS